MKSPILVINTGNTSTKIALYDMDVPIFIESIKHSDEDLRNFESINDQIGFREEMILRFLKDKNFRMVVDGEGFFRGLIVNRKSTNRGTSLENLYQFKT